MTSNDAALARMPMSILTKSDVEPSVIPFHRAQRPARYWTPRKAKTRKTFQTNGFRVHAAGAAPCRVSGSPCGGDASHVRLP
jgi:hypothetical protein